MPYHCPWCCREFEGVSGALGIAPSDICDECALRLHLVRTLWQNLAWPERFRFVVICRARAALYESVSRALEGFVGIRVLIDRRYGERRSAATPAQSDRRSGRDRRRARKDVLLV